MHVETEYLPGVVDCELSWFTRAEPALEAQVIAARTYLARHLARRAESDRPDEPDELDAVVPIGPRFQCWRRARHERSRRAAARTVGIVMRYDGTLITANYASGTKVLDETCRAGTPAEAGYDDESWESMTRRYRAAKHARRRRPFRGIQWTEILVTDNAGREGDAVRPTPHSPPGRPNRGGLGQYRAACLSATLGLETEDILRHFYGNDIELTPPLPPPRGVRVPALDAVDTVHEILGELVIPGESKDDTNPHREDPPTSE